MRILRKYYQYANLDSSSFSIVDDDDAQKLFDIAVEQCPSYGKVIYPDIEEYMSDAEYEKVCKAEEKQFNSDRAKFAKDAKSKVLRWKESGLSLKTALETISERGSVNEEIYVDIYEAYQNELEKRNSVDFADLILKVVGIFEEYPDIATEISKRLQYVLVDEFQDTNMLQYDWLMHLVKYHGNLFVVGDIDQSLYSFRGSAPQIMQNLSNRWHWMLHLKQSEMYTTNLRSRKFISGP